MGSLNHYISSYLAYTYLKLSKLKISGLNDNRWNDIFTIRRWYLYNYIVWINLICYFILTDKFSLKIERIRLQNVLKLHSFFNSIVYRPYIYQQIHKGHKVSGPSSRCMRVKWKWRKPISLFPNVVELIRNSVSYCAFCFPWYSSFWFWFFNKF